MKDLSDNLKMNIIAHEIAHFVLGHHLNPKGKKSEEEADDLIAKWGFDRCYGKIAEWQQ